MVMLNVEPKEIVRNMMRVALAKISPSVRAVESIDLCARLKLQMHSAHTVLFFAPMADELDVWPLLLESLKSGKVIATINLSGHAPRMPMMEMQVRFLPYLRQAANELSVFLR